MQKGDAVLLLLSSARNGVVLCMFSVGSCKITWNYNWQFAVATVALLVVVVVVFISDAANAYAMAYTLASSMPLFFSLVSFVCAQLIWFSIHSKWINCDNHGPIRMCAAQKHKHKHVRANTHSHTRSSLLSGKSLSITIKENKLTMKKYINK